jgi:hypothetical protein
MKKKISHSDYFFFILLFWRVFSGVCAIFHATPPRPRAVDSSSFSPLTCFSHLKERFQICLENLSTLVIRCMVIHQKNLNFNFHSIFIFLGGWPAKKKNNSNSFRYSNEKQLTQILSPTLNSLVYNVDFHPINYPNQ